MTGKVRTEKIVIQNLNGLKSYIIDNCIFFCDILLFLLICSYIKYIGINNIDIIELISPLLIRAIYSFVLYRFDKSSENYENINNFMMPKIISFLIYMSFIFSYKESDKGILNDAIGSYIFCFTLLILLIFSIKTIFNFFKGIEKDKIEDLNKYLNIVFLMAFSFFISSNNFNDIKNYIFSSTINNDIIEQIKDFNLYLTIVLIFFVTHLRSENNMIFKYGRKINSMLVLATLVFISIHIYENIKRNSIDYGFISYLMIIMILSVLVINIVIDYESTNRKKIFYILFKIFFIFYTTVKGLDVFPNFLMEIILLVIIYTIGFKNSPLNSNATKLIKIIAGVVGLFLVYTIVDNYLNDIQGNKAEYIGLVIITLAGLSLPAKNYENNEDYKKIIKSIFNVFYFNYIHESIRIKKELIKDKGYLNVKPKIVLGLAILPIYLIVGHYGITLMAAFIKYMLLSSDVFMGFMIYVFYINEVTSTLLNILGSLTFQALLMFFIFITSLIVMRIFFTNERVLLVSPLHFEYAVYNYNELNVIYDNNKCYLTCNDNKLYQIKKDEIEKYLKRKIKESLANVNVD